MNTSKIILDLCGGTGAWSKPYKDGGYKVINITLPRYDVKQVARRGDALELRLKTTSQHVPMRQVHGILAAPPCTEFSLAKNSMPRNFEGAMSTVVACLQIIWDCRIYGNLKWWALENPRGFLRQFLGRPHYTFEAWWFGDNMKKPTDLWGYFTEPADKINRGAVRPAYPRKGKGSWAYQHPTKGAPDRSITPPAFAQAFFKANP